MGYRAHSAERRRAIADSSRSLEPAVLEPSTSGSEQRMPPARAEGRISRVAGERPRWAWALGIVVALAVIGAGATAYIGYDVVRPLRGLLIPGSLREDAPTVLPVSGTVEPQPPSKRAQAYAERERDAPRLAAAAPTPSPSAGTLLRRSDRLSTKVTVELPQGPEAQPSLDNPYGVLWAP